MLFENYGLFWQRARVHWGEVGRGKTGHLKGFCANAKKSGRVDFREQRGIYALYDDNFRLIYVGQAGYGNSRLFARLKAHTGDHLAERWSRFSWFGTLPAKESDFESGVEIEAILEEKDEIDTNTKSVLDHTEAVLILAAEPPLNRRGGNFGEAKQYLQYKDSEHYGTWDINDKLDSILEVSEDIRNR